MFKCIGKIRSRNEVVECRNESAVPTNPAHPEWGYLCPACANRPPERFSKRLTVDVLDLDTPNSVEETTGAGEGYSIAPQARL